MPVFKLIMDLGLLLKMNSNQKWRISIDQNKCFLFSKKYILFSLLSFAKAICQQCFLTAYSRVTTIYIEPNQCPSHQSILLTQGPIHENFMKKYWELAELENEVFLRRPFWIFKSAILNFFFASFHWKMQPISMRGHFFLHYGWFFQNLRKEAVRTFMHTTVILKANFVHLRGFFLKFLNSYRFITKSRLW